MEMHTSGETEVWIKPFRIQGNINFLLGIHNSLRFVSTPYVFFLLGVTRPFAWYMVFQQCLDRTVRIDEL